MKRYVDIFNGDADGLCALHQLRMAFPVEAILVTGVKRDIALLERVQAAKGDQLTVLDISLDANCEALRRHLAAGAEVLYFDHHTARHAFNHPYLERHWSNAGDVCTSILVSQYLQDRYIVWAIVAAFGDNLQSVARGLASRHGLNEADSNVLQELGQLLNYNSYGERVEDLHIHPAALYQELHRYSDPFAFIHESSYFLALQYAYSLESASVAELRPYAIGRKCAIYILPDTLWSHRLSGVLANNLIQNEPFRSFAVLTPQKEQGYLVSVRSAEPDRKPASSLCLGFDEGGGRSAAAGINHLDEQLRDVFCRRFLDYFEAA
ncbi:acetyltransferase [Undibacterium oligocarboniphilum]|uniref:Acetyltransferase n=1 Tax=Undibacterium oligocarboniphilum TaxID=666702 RepID=A0A850QJW5_9BURK|nr:acetyltransferase [Undibacterium oligocarboniphilum]NVO76714.1 acetyltransferase [Undibacterium oligocarboniphilum]